MDKKILIWGVFIVILAIITGLGVDYYGSIPQSVKNKDLQYYFHLSRGCRRKQSASCCNASVRIMMRNKFKLVTETGCPEGFAPNAVRCDDSYHWCQPINKNLNQQSKESIPNELD